MVPFTFRKGVWIVIVNAIPVDVPKRVKTYLLTFAPNEDSNQSVHPRSLIRVFVIRMKSLCIFGCPKWAVKIGSDCANAQADPNLRLAHMSDATLHDVVAQMITLNVRMYIDTFYNRNAAKTQRLWHANM